MHSRRSSCQKQANRDRDEVKIKRQQGKREQIHGGKERIEEITGAEREREGERERERQRQRERERKRERGKTQSFRQLRIRHGGNNF